MPLINWKVELKIKWKNYFALPAAGVDNVNNTDNKIVFTITDIKLYVPVVTLSARDSKNLLKFLSTRFKRSVYSNEYKTKSETKTTTNEFRNFLESSFIGINRLFQLVYLKRSDDVKRFKTRRNCLAKGIIKNYNVVINGKKNYDQAIN